MNNKSSTELDKIQKEAETILNDLKEGKKEGLGALDDLIKLAEKTKDIFKEIDNENPIYNS